MRSHWIIGSVPASLGLLGAALIDIGWLSNWIITTSANLNALSIYAGIMVSLLVIIGLWIREGSERTSRQHIRQLQQEAEQRICQIQEQAAMDRNRIFYDLRHELEQPTTRLNFQVAELESIVPDGILRDREAKIKAIAHHLGGLTAALRNLHGIETGLPAYAPVDVAALLDEVIAAIQERAEVAERSLTHIHYRVDPFPLPLVNGNEHLLHMAIYNLLDNALKYTRPGGRIAAEVGRDGTHVVVRVSDTGSGIPDNELSLVWSPFFRSDETRSWAPGHGLGLALVRAIVTRHEGQVSLESRLGVGTVITLRLPGMSET